LQQPGPWHFLLTKGNADERYQVPQARQAARTVQLLGRHDPIGSLAITVGKARNSYILQRVPADFGTAFALTKLVLVEIEPGVHEQRYAETYHVHFDRTLGDRCDCRGFVAHRHCKHRDALAELIGQGLL
jgi:hypothetical protein